MKEMKIGQTFDFELSRFQCIEFSAESSFPCNVCVFRNENCSEIHHFTGSCLKSRRSDRKSVIFVKIS